MIIAPQDAKKSAENWFKSLEDDGDGSVRFEHVLHALKNEGLQSDDPRLADIFGCGLRDSDSLSLEDFGKLIQESSLLVGKALSDRLVLPDFTSFVAEIEAIYEDLKGIDDGEVAQYIPQLAKVPREKFGISLCTIDGQRASFGDSGEPFSIQSISKVVSYCLALNEKGRETVHRHVGREPSGQSFNEISLNADGKPHNPLINAGAIMCASLIQEKARPADRFNHMMAILTRLSGGPKPVFNNAVYLSERDKGDRNFALAYFMRERNAFPENTNILEVLDFYFQCCSIEMSTDAMAVMAATFANAGLCPLTEERIFEPDHVKDALSLMATCGMYNFSGEFAFSIGLPAKSGVGGGLMVVVPNVLGISIWSPPLTAQGNPVRGVEFCRRLVERFNFHNFDSLVANSPHKVDPRKKLSLEVISGPLALCWAAFQGDLHEIRHLIASGVDPNAADYSGKTALHLAAREGHVNVVKYLLGIGVNDKATDRNARTAEDEARFAGFEAIVELFAAGRTKHAPTEGKA